MFAKSRQQQKTDSFSVSTGRMGSPKARLSVNDQTTDSGEVYLNTNISILKYTFTQVDRLDCLLNQSSKIRSFA